MGEGGGEAGDVAEETEEETGDSGSEEGQLTQFMCDDATMRRATGREVGQGVWCHWGAWVGEWGGGGRARLCVECQEEG